MVNFRHETSSFLKKLVRSQGEKSVGPWSVKGFSSKSLMLTLQFLYNPMLMNLTELNPSSLHPKLYTLNPQPELLYPKHQNPETPNSTQSPMWLEIRPSEPLHLFEQKGIASAK